MLNFRKRRKKIRQYLKKIGVDCFLISNFFNLNYLVNFTGLTPLEREGWLIIGKRRDYFLTDMRYSDFKEKNTDRELVVDFLCENLSFIHWLNRIIKLEKIANFGVEAEDLKLKEFETIKKSYLRNKIKTKIIILDNVVSRLREVKDKDELMKIRKAGQLANLVFRKAIKKLTFGITERDLAFEIESLIRNSKAEPAFFPIVAFGQNSAIPHYHTKKYGETKLKADTVILLDFGIEWSGYCCDLSRVVFFRPQNKDFLMVYQKLLDLYLGLINYINKKKPNKANLIDIWAKERFSQQFPKIEVYSHSTGHGVGLEVHELPRISKNSLDNLKKNQVFTLEPGVYLRGNFGMRIEDTFYLTGNLNLKKLTNISLRPLIAS